jgi:hypothetical protein
LFLTRSAAAARDAPLVPSIGYRFDREQWSGSREAEVVEGEEGLGKWRGGFSGSLLILGEW